MPDVTGSLTSRQLLDACADFTGQRILVVVGGLKGFVDCTEALLDQATAAISAQAKNAALSISAARTEPASDDNSAVEVDDPPDTETESSDSDSDDTDSEVD
jgi:hypothetical protein